MRFRLEADPGELAAKGDAFLKALLEQIEPVAPGLSAQLEKALPDREPVLKFPALQGLASEVREEYARTLERMNAEIGKVLEQAVENNFSDFTKGEFFDFTQDAFDRDADLYARAKSALIKRGYRPSDFDEGGPLFGYSTNQLIEMAGEQEDDLGKAGGPFIGPRGGKWADAQHTIPWHEGAAQQLAAKIARRGPGKGREVSLTKSELDSLLKTGRFALVSAGTNPEIESDRNMSPEAVKARHEQLRSRLVGDGFAFTQVVGHYGGVEDSFLVMVHDADRGHVQKIGEEFNQDSVIYSDHGRHELLFTTGDKAKAKAYVPGIGHKIVRDAKTAFYTEVRHPDGTMTKFVLRLNFANERTRKAMLEALELQKAGGPYVGPKGGLWADPQHTQHWDPTNSPGRAAQSQFGKVVAQYGGKIVDHETDPNLSVVKIPTAHVAALAAIKAELGLPGEITTGHKYAMISVNKAVLAKISAPKVKAKLDKPKLVEPKAPAPATQGTHYYQTAWQPHATLEEATSWAKLQGVDTKYPDLATANQCNKALSEQHPWVRRHVEFLGSSDALHAWGAEHPEINARAKAEAKHKEDLTEFHLGGNAIAIAHPTTKKPYTQSVIALHPGWATAEKYAKKKQYCKPGFSQGTELTDTVRHEFGHVEGFIFRHLYPNGKSSASAWDIWKEACVTELKANTPGVMKSVSEYGATNPHECWAEISVMRRNGKPIPKWAQAAIDKMKIDTVPWEKMGEVK